MATILRRPHAPALPHNAPQRMCRGLGWVMLVIGVLGFGAPGLLGMHLGFIQNMLHLVLGTIAIWMGQNARVEQAANFSMGAGAFLALLGVIGFVFGDYGIPTMGNLADVTEDRFLLEPIPSWLELGTNDHIVHLVIGSVFLLSAVLWKGREKATVSRHIRRHMDGY